MLVAGCAAPSRIARDAPFVPTMAETRASLREDRVEQALPMARELFARFPGPATQAILGQALWRNGELREAEAYFRRASRAGNPAGQLGLAMVRASTGKWLQARELATLALRTSETEPEARALLVGMAWRVGDLQATRAHLEAWARAQPSPGRRARIEATAKLLGSLMETPRRWSGDASVVQLSDSAGAMLVPVDIDGVEAHLSLSLSAGRSWVTPRLAAAAGLRSELAANPEPERAGSGSRIPSTSSHPVLDVLVPRVWQRQATVGRLRIGACEISHFIVGVDAAPPGADGVLGADVLASMQWTLDPDNSEFALAPPQSRRSDMSPAARQLLALEPMRVAGWAHVWTLYHGLEVRWILFPRIGGEMLASSVEINGRSVLDPGSSVDMVASETAILPLSFGSLSRNIRWQFADLSRWALQGRVAPRAIMGGDAFAGLQLHWHPQNRLLTLVDVPADSATARQRIE